MFFFLDGFLDGEQQYFRFVREGKKFSRVEWGRIELFPWLISRSIHRVENRKTHVAAIGSLETNTDTFRDNDRTHSPVFLEVVCTPCAFVVESPEISTSICLSHIRRGTWKSGKSGFTVNGSAKKSEWIRRMRAERIALRPTSGVYFALPTPKELDSDARKDQ